MPAHPVTLVLVDDDEDFRSAARQLFTFRGYSVLCEAGCIASALTHVRRRVPDVVVVDIHLGDESGFDLARELTGEHPGLAVVLMSADKHAGEAEHVRASGARGFLHKSEIISQDLAELL